MAKRMVVVLLVSSVFLGAIFIIYNLGKKNDTVLFDKSYVWHSEDDASGAGILVRGRKLNEVRNDVNKLVIALNKFIDESEAARPQGDGVRTDFPKIAMEKVEQQIAIVTISNDEYLSQKMGSSGAQDLLAEVTYTLTEYPGIKSVNFMFQPGDHAMPGVYSRDSFANYKLVIEDSRQR